MQKIIELDHRGDNQAIPKATHTDLWFGENSQKNEAAMFSKPKAKTKTRALSLKQMQI